MWGRNTEPRRQLNAAAWTTQDGDFAARKCKVEGCTTLCLTVPFGIGRRSLFFVTLEENASREAPRRKPSGPSSISR